MKDFRRKSTILKICQNRLVRGAALNSVRRTGAQLPQKVRERRVTANLRVTGEGERKGEAGRQGGREGSEGGSKRGAYEREVCDSIKAGGVTAG